MPTTNTSENSVKFIPLGAIIQEFVVAGKNIVLGYPSAAAYPTDPFFGETVGRVANRIKDGIVQLNNKTHQLPKNNGEHSLHGGSEGWGKKVFDGPHLSNRNSHESVQFSYISPDGDQDYPGTVEVRIWYTAWEDIMAGTKIMNLEIEYEVELVGDECEETVVNVTNHRYAESRDEGYEVILIRRSYFNLTDGPTIYGTECTLSTNIFQAVDDDSIPTGPLESFPGIDVGKSFVLGPEHSEIDHCFVIDKDLSKVPLDTRSRDLQTLVTMSCPETRLHLEVRSTEPAFQFYTGKYIDMPASEHGPAYGPNSGLCIEAGRCINAINIPEWRNTVLLKKGELWGSKIGYRAWKA